MKKLRDHLPDFFSMQPVVSISCIHYNHEASIRNTLDSFLNQKTNFPVEILLNDDKSTDTTAEIIKEYTERFPYIFKPVYQAENQYGKGIRGLHQYFNFDRALGKYLAICDGDDAWIDEDKLQKQVTFLESNSSFTMVSHNAYLSLYKKKKNVVSFFSIFFWNLKKGTFKGVLSMLMDIFQGNERFWNRQMANTRGKEFRVADFETTFKTHFKGKYIPSSSIVGRADILRRIPRDVNICPTGHKMHVLWPSIFGNLYHMKACMSIKNNQANSLTVSKQHKSSFSKQKMYSNYIEIYTNLKVYMSAQQQFIVDKILNELKSELSGK